MSDSEYRTDTYTSGMGVYYSTVRITHIPTGMSEQCDKHKSQYKNKTEAMDKLKKRIEGNRND